jgi:hypothetical protein
MAAEQGGQLSPCDEIACEIAGIAIRRAMAVRARIIRGHSERQVPDLLPLNSFDRTWDHD